MAQASHLFAPAPSTSIIFVSTGPEQRHLRTPYGFNSSPLPLKIHYADVIYALRFGPPFEPQMDEILIITPSCFSIEGTTCWQK